GLEINGGQFLDLGNLTGPLVRALLNSSIEHLLHLSSNGQCFSLLTCRSDSNVTCRLGKGYLIVKRTIHFRRHTGEVSRLCRTACFLQTFNERAKTHLAKVLKG